jgi:hypothetical protein
MCDATEPAVDIWRGASIEGLLSCDLLDLFEVKRKWFTWEDLPLFTGHG